VLCQSIQSNLLVGAKLNHGSHRVEDYYSRKPSPLRLGGQLFKCPSISSYGIVAIPHQPIPL
jgi:hypothetical protein